MHPMLKDLESILETEDRLKAIEWATSKLASGQLDIVTLYTALLGPALNQMTYREDEKKYWVWKEHVRSSIVRSVIENCHPYVIKEATKAKPTGKKAVVACPPEEYHDIGARMVADLFTICGYSVIFVGANTPVPETIVAVECTRPSLIALSVSNYYNLFALRNLIVELRKAAVQEEKGLNPLIVVGGHAFRNNPEAYRDIGADRLVMDFNDIKALALED